MLDSKAGVEQLDPGLGTVVGIVLVLLSVSLLKLFCLKFFHGYTDDIQNRNPHSLVLSSPRFSGVDPQVINSLPFFHFSSLSGSKDGLDCAVCISEFEETEILRLLPECGHAFHRNCIDQWLERRSSCPLCRHKFDPKNLSNVTYSKSIRYMQNPCNLSEDPNLVLFVQREQDQDQGSSSFKIKTNSPGNANSKIEEMMLIEEGAISDSKWKFNHKLNHKIIVSDAIINNRWSEFNCSDLLFLNSEMLSPASSNRFSQPALTSTGLNNDPSWNENVEQTKEDVEKKRLSESGH